MQQWPWADYVDTQLRTALSQYRESPGDVSVQVYYDSDDGASKAQLALGDGGRSDEPMVRIRVSTSSHKFGSGVTMTTDAEPLTKELCLRYQGRDLSPAAAGGWSFVVAVPGLSTAGGRGVKIRRRLKSIALWGLVLGPLALILDDAGLGSAVGRRFLPECTRHETCSPGFCDRGRCMSLQRSQSSMFGAPCAAAAACGEFVCSDRRCSSCEEDEECTSKSGEELYCSRRSMRRSCRNADVDRYVGP
jgi:hypothetical protein